MSDIATKMANALRAIVVYDNEPNAAERPPASYLQQLLAEHEATMPSRIVITIEKGAVGGIYSSEPVHVRIVDYDCDGMEPDVIQQVQFTDPECEAIDALVHEWTDDIGIDPEWVEGVFNLPTSD